MREKTTEQQDANRQTQLLQLLDNAGAWGATRGTLGHRLGIHHDKVSGALNNLHTDRRVFVLRTTPFGSRSHLYIHARYRGCWSDNDVYDTPRNRNKPTKNTSNEKHQPNNDNDNDNNDKANNTMTANEKSQLAFCRERIRLLNRDIESLQDGIRHSRARIDLQEEQVKMLDARIVELKFPALLVEGD